MHQTRLIQLGIALAVVVGGWLWLRTDLCVDEPGLADQLIAFVSADDIYTVTADGCTLTQLTTDPARDFSPRWSPDGRFITFLSHRASAPGLYIMRADGSDQRLLMDHRILPGEDIDESPLGDHAWSPDSRSLVWVVGGTLYHLDSATASTTPQTASVRRPFWSPDGRWLAYERTVGTPPFPAGIALMEVETGHERLLTAAKHYLLRGWSPDGAVLWVEWMEQGAQLGTLELADGDYTPYREGNIIVWSPDGTRSAVTSTQGTFSRVQVFQSLAFTETNTLRFGQSYLVPSWASDSTWIAVAADPKPCLDPQEFLEYCDLAIMRMRADGSDLVQLTDLDGHETDPVWQPRP